MRVACLAVPRRFVVAGGPLGRCGERGGDRCRHDMLAHADLVIAARSARFVMPFTALGLVPEAASSLLFLRLVGHQRASALLLLGEPMDAETARDWGFV